MTVKGTLIPNCQKVTFLPDPIFIGNVKVTRVPNLANSFYPGKLSHWYLLLNTKTNEGEIGVDRYFKVLNMMEGVVII